MAASPLRLWAQALSHLYEQVRTTGAPPYKLPLGSRVLMLGVGMPVCCGTCFGWSAIWRILACPFQCIRGGPGMMCSNNSCTRCSDTAIGDYYERATKGVKMGAMPGLQGATREDLAHLKGVLADVVTFLGTQGGRRYILAEAVHTAFDAVNTPFHVSQALEAVLTDVSAMI